MSNKAHIDLTDFYNSDDDLTDAEINALIGEPLSESEAKKIVEEVFSNLSPCPDFDINQLNLNEINSIHQEFYTLEETKKHLKKKFPDEEFENGDIANLVAENKLDLRVTFADEMLLSRAWITDKKKNFQGDYGIEYKRFYSLESDDVVILTNPLLSFALVYSTTIGQAVIDNIIKHIGSNYLTGKPFTKYGVLLCRGDKYWKVVRTHYSFDPMNDFSEDVEEMVYQECFMDKATWGISAGSLERYCDTKNNISKSENSKKANQTQHGDKYALYEQIKPLWREKRHLIDSGELSRKKFAMKVLDSPLNHGLNGSKIMCGENSWRTITKLIKEWESEEN